MILGIGNDLECIERVKQMLVKLPKTATKILTPAELTIFAELSSKRQGEFLAGRFSAKEAYSKAVGTGIGQTISFLDIEILNDPLGRPYFSHHPLENECNAFISISHTKEHVATMVVLEKIK